MSKDKIWFEDCFAFQRNNQKETYCRALKVSDCENCKFYKSKETYLKEIS